MSTSSKDAPPTMRVRLLKAGKVVRSFIVKKDTFTIGSGQEAAVRIGGIPDLAPKHALIWLDDGIPTLVPSSGSLVLVNGQQTKHAQLGPDDTVSLGKLEIQIESLVETSAAAQPAAPQQPSAAAPVAPAPQMAPPPKAPPPKAAPPPKVQTAPPPSFSFDSSDEDRTQVSAPPPNFGPPATSTPAASPPAAMGSAPFFGEDERTIPAQKAYSPEQLQSGEPTAPDMELTEEERNALADLLPFATPVPPSGASEERDLEPPKRDDFFEQPQQPEPAPQPVAGIADEPEVPRGATPQPTDFSWSDDELPQQHGEPEPAPPQASPEPPTERAPSPPFEEPGLPTADTIAAGAAVAPPVEAAPAAPEPQPAPAAMPASNYYDDGDYVDDDDYFDDDEEDEEDFVEPFSLVEHLAREAEPPAREGRLEKYLAAEVVRHGEGRLWDVSLVKPGQSYRPGPGLPELLRMDKKGQCVITVPQDVEGTLWVGGDETALSARPPDADGMRKITLGEGDKALIATNQAEHLIQVLRPPKKFAPGFLSLALSMLGLLGFTLGIGGVLILTFWSWSQYFPPDEEPDEPIAEAFEEISVNDLALIAAQVEDAPEVEEEEEAVEEEDSDAAVEEMEPERTPRTRRRRSRAASAGGGGRTAASRLLNALRTGGSSSSGASLSDVITNIDSVGSNSATTGLFRTTGVFSSMPGGDVKVARRGGSGGVNTVGGGALSKSSPGLGRVEGSGGKRGKVRGRVSRVSSQARVRGNLDRSEVLRVINSRMGAITRCYERRLMTNPSLSGRVVFGWTIAPSGGVGGVAVRSSSISDPAVASCIAGVIRRMRFPRPEGGAVSISFPFLFRAVDI